MAAESRPVWRPGLEIRSEDVPGSNTVALSRMTEIRNDDRTSDSLLENIHMDDLTEDERAVFGWISKR